MKNSVMLFALAASFLLAQRLVLAHHGSAGYNNKDLVTVTGTATEFQFVNPHCIISINVKDAKGQVQKWQGELTSPNHLVRAGWTAQTFKPGEEVTLTGFRAKTGANSMWITKVVLGNGEEMKTGGGN